MARRINRVVLYICNGCQSVFNEGRDAKAHWRAAHAAARAAPRPAPRAARRARARTA